MLKSTRMLKSRGKKGHSRPGASSLSLLAAFALVLMATGALWRLGGWGAIPRPAGTAVTEVRAGINPGDSQVTQASSDRVESRHDVGSTKVPGTPLRRRLSAALAAIQNEPDFLRRADKLDALAQEIAVADLPAAIEFLNDGGGSEKNETLKLQLVRRWAANSPRLAADWVATMTNNLARQEAVNGVAIVWANQNLSDAIEWVQQLPEGAERNGGMLNVAYEAARAEPTAALKLAMSLPPGESREDLITHATSEWAAKDPAAALQWADQIYDANLRNRTLKHIVTAWSESDPNSAAAVAMKSLPEGTDQDDAIIGIVQRWVQKEPREAAAWVTEFPQIPLRDTALEELVKLWSDRNLQQAGNWLNGLVPGAVRDVAAGAYVGKIALQFPELAVDWAKGIGDESLRLRGMEVIGEAWMGKDAPNARAWIEQTTLPETTKVRLLALRSD